jgi:hypothetical protein
VGAGAHCVIERAEDRFLSYSAIGGFGRFGFWIADLGLGFPNLDSIASRESPNPRSQSSIPILDPESSDPESSDP